MSVHTLPRLTATVRIPAPHARNKTLAHSARGARVAHAPGMSMPMTVNAIRALRLRPAQHRLCVDVSLHVSTASEHIRRMLAAPQSTPPDLADAHCTWRPAHAADCFVLLEHSAARPLLGLAMHNAQHACTGVQYFEADEAPAPELASRGRFVLFAQLTLDHPRDDPGGAPSPVLLVYDGYDPTQPLPPAAERYQTLLAHRTSLERCCIGDARCTLQWVGPGKYADRVCTMSDLPHETNGLLVVRDRPPHALAPATCHVVDAF